MPPELLNKWASSADILIAADAGADRLLAVGKTPDIIVGDFDSVSAEALACGAELVEDRDQSLTDADKMLHLAAKRRLLPLTLACVEGDRLDHVFATVHSVAVSGAAPRVTLALRRGLAWVFAPGEHGVRVPRGRRVSLIPLATVKKLTTAGLKWELREASLEAGILTSVSNQSVAERVELNFQQGLMLVVVEYLQEEFPRW